MSTALNAFELRAGETEWKWKSPYWDLELSPDRNVLLIGSSASAYESRLRKLGLTPVPVQSIHEARNLLLMDYFRQQKSLPEAIIFDTRLDAQLIGHFASYLSVTREFAGIPLIGLMPATGEGSIPGICGLDDFLSTGCTEKDLVAKIEVLRKYKRLRQTLPYHWQHDDKHPFRVRFVLQRIVDILVSSVILIISAPVMLGIALVIRLESEGPVFYMSPRAGRGYRIFKFLKFRTMVTDADKKFEDLKHLNQYKDGVDGPQFFKIEKDPRVTRVGKFLRNSSLDELPQLFNVLKGDMSLVGNRPLPLYEAKTLVVDEAARRFLAPAGITGLWQIKKRGLPNMSAQERIDLDIDYANRHSFFYDMKILLNTPKALLQKTDV